ncbi:PorT family protein [Flavobacteriaceae bacterium AU392]|nr:PorT family protein [Flavobacteriaceae bacterium]RKM86834.1 PorT family protein [Flavobacteriaceae bacterium AU392]
MKKLFLLTVFSCFAICSWAQVGSSYGFKGGLNYNSNGDLIETATSAAENPDRNIGFHIGIFGKLGNKLYFRPELIYTNTQSEYSDEDFKLQKLDAPLLVGLKLIGPISVFAGPSLQYILNSDFDGIDIDDVENDLTVGFNFGVSFSYKKFGVDLRYERGFNDNEAQFLNNNNIDISRLDTRPEQFILSLSVAI